MAGDTPSQLSLLPQRRHSHLRLAAALSPGTRRRTPRGFRRPPQYPDRAEHARTIGQQTLRAVETFRTRTPVLGVDPELVLVLELNRPLDPELVERSGLQVLELFEEKVLIAFAADPELIEFHRRREAYSQGARPSEDGADRSAQYEDLFDTIVIARSLEVSDVLAPDLETVLADPRLSTDRLLRLDVQCWCPEDSSEARRRHDEVQRAVLAATGQVLDAALRDTVGLSVLRVELPAVQVAQLAKLDRIRRIDLLPRPLLSQIQYRSASLNSLPEVLPPPADAATVAVIDSGARSAHPLLATAVVGFEVVGRGLADGGDQHGHGTLVASLALHGQLETALAERTPLRPAGRLLSIRVLDAKNQFPDDRLWEEQLLEALTLAIEAGARVINLSLGDPRRPYRPPRPTPLAAAIDGLARKHNVVVVLTAGNYDHHQADARLAGDYPARLLNDSEAGLLDPATAALALTVGSLCTDSPQGVWPARERVDVQPLGAPGRPSPFTRRGPGAMGMVKPEVSAPGGSHAIDHGMGRLVADQTLMLVGAGGERPEQLLACDAGTSLATPLVSHAALRVLSRYPSLSGNAVRALVLASVTPLDTIIAGVGPARISAEQRRLTGYGRVNAERAEASGDHRAVLVSESALVVDDVHLYTVPVPSTFFGSGGARRLTVALAYDPPVRPTRLDYLGSRMLIRAFRGLSVAAVRDAYAQQLNTNDALDLSTDEIDEIDEAPPALRNREVKLQPSDTHRARGAHQLGTFTFGQRLDAARGRELIIAVRNVNRWDAPGSTQPYALVVVLERDEDHAQLYDELHDQLEALAEIEIEIE